MAMIAEAKRRYALPMRTLAAEMGLSPATLSTLEAAVAPGTGGRGPTRPAQGQTAELQTSSRSGSRALSTAENAAGAAVLLHRAYAGGISRRELDAMVRAVRQETSRAG